ncbi:alpha/beta hydrolase [Dyella sp. GSA-30]|uniref:alpha/beta fold hydrolase n=1 Tax=Dyella sp. GSA-30 TaxID=2994496 RepID=UPI0024936506|nr:alpha/beta hydrolase [Dyella sp. GSA-30]BDU19725.1 lipase [Dyella sp. GSA-30]
MHAPVERSIALPHLTLRAQVWGSNALPALLALHGWLDNAASFATLAPLLADRWQVIALDLPGHGHSDHLPEGALYHYVDYVRCVLGAVDALGLEHYSLLGHSMGAGIASLIAAAAPASIEHLALIEGLGPIGDDGSHTLQRFRDALTLAPTKSSRRGLRVFRDIEQAASARAIASGLSAELARPIIERGLMEITDGWHWRSDPRLNRATPLRLAETQIMALLHGIEAPTALLLSAPHTPYLPPTQMSARAACVGDIAVTHMEGGHHLHLEQSEPVAQWLLKHLILPASSD